MNKQNKTKTKPRRVPQARYEQRLDFALVKFCRTIRCWQIINGLSNSTPSQLAFHVKIDPNFSWDKFLIGAIMLNIRKIKYKCVAQ